MRRSLRKAIVVLALLVGSALAFVSSPVNAGSTTITDGNGVDFDADCLVSTSLAPPAPNSYHGGGCRGVSLADGSTESLDLNGFSAATLSSDAYGRFTATCTVDGPIPPAGSTFRGGYDLPSDSWNNGGTCYVLFQNKTIQTSVSYVACPQIPPRPTPVLNRWGTWKDGFHFFLAYAVYWDGSRWIHSAQIGEYDPGPTGGLGFLELGVNDGSGWQSFNVYHPFGTGASMWSASVSGSTMTVTAPGVYQEPDPIACLNGHYDYWFGKPGDIIGNVKALTGANEIVILPVTIPVTPLCGATGGLVCLSDIRTVGGYVLFSDTTEGNSTAGLLNTNIADIAYSHGLLGRPGAPTYLMALHPVCHLLELEICPQSAYVVPDTLGPGPTCPLPTFGGLLPQNPLFTPNTPCHIDDDSISRGSFLPEFWDTWHGFTF